MEYVLCDGVRMQRKSMHDSIYKQENRKIEILQKCYKYYKSVTNITEIL